jgi:Kef-type K+ transport system membrane component KefB/nucleotide-binding universal stress UspA family protein
MTLKTSTSNLPLKFAANQRAGRSDCGAKCFARIGRSMQTFIPHQYHGSMVTLRNWRLRTPMPGIRIQMLRPAILLAGLFAFIPTAALAAQNVLSENAVALFIAELGVLLLVGRLMGEAAQRIGQPPVMGQLIGGVVLGPSVLGLLWPHAEHALFLGGAAQKATINGVGQLGILMLLLLTGMETDLPLVKRVGRTAVAVAIAGVAIPFACGVLLGESLPDSLLPKPDARMITALFLGTALSISSVKIVAMVVREMNFMRRDIGQIIVASAILEDTIGWVIIAIAFGLASSGGIDALSIARAVLGALVFLGVSLTIGRRVVFSLIRWTNDNFRSEFPVITTILVIMIGMALITQWLGVNMVLGAFVAGVLVGESPILTRHIDEALRGLTVALFMPVFFGLAGLSADPTVLKDPHLALLAIAFIFIACAGKFLGAFVGGKLGGMVRDEALALACAMNARGSTEVIVASIGLSMGVFSQNLFTLIVTMAIITTVSMPPMLRWSLKRLPMREEERIRLEHEELDARSFVSNLERLLVVVDDSSNGKFAAQLAGVIGGSGGKPMTVLEMKAGGRDDSHGGSTQERKEAAAKAQDEASAREVQSAAERVTTLEAHPDDEKPGHIEVTTVRKHFIGPEEVAAEARKGHDLLIIGIANTHDKNGGFSNEISQIAKGFEGPLAVVDSQGAQLDRFAEPPSKILVPVNGTEFSRRAAEVAFTLARANNAQANVLYVTRAATGGPRTNRQTARATRHSDEAVLEDIGTLADRYEVNARGSICADVAPDEAIIQEAKSGYDLIVLGANRRPGDSLFFGNTVAAVLDRSPIPKLFVAS